MDDPCARVFKPGTKSICICHYLMRNKTSTVEELARHCGTTKTMVLYVLKRLEEEGLAKRVYRNDVDYTVMWLL